MQAAEAGMQTMTCTYFDQSGKTVLVESIPMP
jgi:uncharacterized protein YbcV (DUF1398 family)